MKMIKRKIITVCVALLLILTAICVAKGSNISTNPVSEGNAENFAVLLTDLVNAYEDKDGVTVQRIESDLEEIRAVDRKDYDIAVSIADHWERVFLDPDYKLFVYHDDGTVPDLSGTGIPNSRKHALVILGFELKNGQMQPELTARCEAAAALARALPETIIVCTGGATGDNNPDRNTEAGLMKKYLVENCGIDASRIYTDDAAMTTAENALNTMKILRQQKAHSMTIVTSAYHQCWGQADYNAVAAIYNKQHGYNIEIIGNFSCDVEPATEIYRTGWRIAAVQIAGILELPDEVIKSMPSIFPQKPGPAEQKTDEAA